MRVLHTSDWHVGKAIRGRSRADEHRAVLAEIVGVAAQREVDVVLVAGDLFETAAPTAESEDIVYRALLAFAETGACVAVIAGNHDNGRRLAAVAPLFALGRVQLLAEPARPGDGGVQMLTGRSGQQLRLAMLPFVSQRSIVRADEIMGSAAYETAQLYGDRLRRVIDALCTGSPSDVVSVVMTHLFVTGGVTGGGERAAHLIEEYGVSAQVFPPTVGYVALGHLHRAQKLAGATQIHYCGSPLQLDFGEQENAPQVNIVDLEVGRPARVEAVPLRSGSRLRSLRGSLEELSGVKQMLDDTSWYRVSVREDSRVGLADEVRDLLGERVVDIRIENTASAAGSVTTRRLDGRAPSELFDAYLNERGEPDPRLRSLFAALVDEIHEGVR